MILTQKDFNKIIKKSKLDTITGCINWCGATNNGYGYITKNNKQLKVHRVILVVSLNLDYRDQSFVAMHKCDNTKCVNIEHLTKGTQADNVRDRNNKGRNYFSGQTHCKRGHKFKPENLQIRYGIIYGRDCLACRLIRRNKYKKLKKGNLNDHT